VWYISVELYFIETDLNFFLFKFISLETLRKGRIIEYSSILCHVEFYFLFINLQCTYVIV